MDSELLMFAVSATLVIGFLWILFLLWVRIDTILSRTIEAPSSTLSLHA